MNPVRNFSLSRSKSNNKRGISNEVNKKPLINIELPLKLFKKGKIRDIFLVNDDALLLVATDRISAFDVVMTTGIPEKGKILTQISDSGLIL